MIYCRNQGIMARVVRERNGDISNARRGTFFVEGWDVPLGGANYLSLLRSILVRYRKLYSRPQPWRSSKNSKKEIKYPVHLDFSKAFDEVLIQKICKEEIPTILVKFTASYVEGRKLYLEIYEKNSKNERNPFRNVRKISPIISPMQRQPHWTDYRKETIIAAEHRRLSKNH